MNEHDFFEHLAELTDTVEGAGARASSTLKARIYSSLVQAQADAGRLRPLPETKAAGSPLCLFETLVAAALPDDRVTSKNPCRVCHARVVAERFESPPIFWRHCPYVDFQKK